MKYRVRKTCVIGGQPYEAGDPIDLDALRPGLAGPARRYVVEVAEAEQPTPPAAGVGGDDDAPPAGGNEEPNEQPEAEENDLVLDQPVDQLLVSDQAKRALKKNELLVFGDVLDHFRENGSFETLDGIGKRLSEELVAAVDQVIAPADA